MQYVCIYELTQIHTERSTNPSLLTNIIMRSQLNDDQAADSTVWLLQVSVCLSGMSWMDVQSTLVIQ